MIFLGMGCRDEMNQWVARYSCHKHWVSFLVCFIFVYISFLHSFMYIFFSFVWVGINLFLQLSSSVFETTLRHSSSSPLGMLFSEFLWWSCDSECGIIKSGLNFLSLCGLWRPAKILLLVCMWQGLICYSMFFWWGKQAQFWACFRNSLYPWALHAPKPKPFPQQTRFHVVPSQGVGEFALLRKTASCDSLWTVHATKVILWSVFWIVPFPLHILPYFSLSVHSIAIQFLGSAPKKCDFSAVAICAGRLYAF